MHLLCFMFHHYIDHWFISLVSQNVSFRIIKVKSNISILVISDSQRLMASYNFFFTYVNVYIYI